LLRLAWILILLFILPANKMTDEHCHLQQLVEMGLWKIFIKLTLQTGIFLISAFQVAKITSVYH
jgi:hypothetical protein